MRTVLRFLVSHSGRFVRAVIGALILAWGLFYKDTVIWPLVILGAIPLLSAAFDVCLLGPLKGYGFSGRSIREQIPSHVQTDVNDN